MKILQVSPRYPPHTGGVETHVREISERLVERGYEVTVLTADAGGDVKRRETRNGVEVRRHRGLAPGGTFHVAPGIYRGVRREDADVVHAHNYHSLPMLFAALAVRKEKFVVTPHYHGGSASDLRNVMLDTYRPLGQWALGRADEVIAVSEWERGTLREDFGVQATVIPNGVDIEQFREAEPEERERPYLLTVGRLEEYKGVQHVIRALPMLPEFDLVVAGDGPYRGTLERVAQDVGVADRVTFEGYVDDERLPGMYAGADVHLSFSEFEAYGITIAEALAAGVPCVVREVGGLREWCKITGVVGIEDVEASTVRAATREAAQLGVSHQPASWDHVRKRLCDRYR